MALPRWLALINKRVFNPREIRRGKRPVLVHIGRKSGRSYSTPLDAFAVPGGYAFIVNYGSNCDWVRNVTAAGSATLQIDGDTIALTSPRLLPLDTAFADLPPSAKRPPQWLKITECLRMDAA